MTRITIGITVYNRKKTLERMIASLFASNLNIEGIDYTIRVYDDCSTEFGEDEVRSMFPIRIDFFRHEKNHGADYNMGYMYRDFLNQGDDVLFNCDSDLIFDEEWLEVALKYLPETDGVLSLFNTKEHKTQEDKGNLCLKQDIGNAGTLMTKEAVRQICEHIDEKASYNSFDCNWCDLFSRQGRKLYCTRRSYVQHIGINGYNSNGVADIGEGFRVGNIINGQILGDVLYEAVSGSKTERKTNFNSFLYLFPFNIIPPGKKVAIYGAGAVGQSYKKQVEVLDYCDSLVMIDKNPGSHIGVSCPQILKELECDYIVVAAHFSGVRDEMKRDILEINPSLSGKIVSNVCYSIRL